MKEQKKSVYSINYKLNVKKVKELLSDKNSPLNGFEKHVIQEGLKEILFGTGPINVVTEEIEIGERDITPAMRKYLLDYELIEIDDNIIDSKTGEINIKHKK